MPIRLKRNHPDGNDPVFAAYKQLKRLYDAATPAVDNPQEHECSYGALPCPCLDYILLPGTNEPVDINDANELNQLERWLVEHYSEKVEVVGD